MMLKAREYIKKRLAPRHCLLMTCAMCSMGYVTSYSEIEQQAKDLSQQCEIRVKECAQEEMQITSSHEKSPWVCKTPILPSGESQFPENYFVDFKLRSCKEMTLKEWFGFLKNVSGVCAQLTPDAEAKILGRYQIQDSANNGGGNRPESKSKKSSSDGLEDPLLKKLLRQQYEGSVKSCLDAIAAELGLHWKYENDRVFFYFLNTNTFKIHVIPSATKISTVMNAASNADSGGGGNPSAVQGQSNQVTSVEINTDILGDISKNIEMILTPGIGRYSLSTSTGYITVTDTEDALKRVADYISRENLSITKQVLLNVKVVTVELSDSKQYEIDWQVIFQSLSFGENISSVSSGSPLMNVDFDVKAAAEAANSNSEDQGQLGTVCQFLQGKLGLNSIKLLLGLLSKQGRLSVLTSPSVTTLNLQPVPVQVAQQQNYVSKQSVTTTEQGATTSIETGTVTSGISMNLLPFITEDNQILLQYSINLSDLIRMDSVSTSAASSGGSTPSGESSSESCLQLPVVDNRIFTQKVRMKSGQTLLLAGYEQQKGEGSSSSPLPWVSSFWGSSRNSSEHKSTIILITPIILK